MADLRGNGDELHPLASIDRLVARAGPVDGSDLSGCGGKCGLHLLDALTGLTWGNLSSHLSKLEEAGYVETEKEFVDKKPHTMIRLTARGARPCNRIGRSCSAS